MKTIHLLVYLFVCHVALNGQNVGVGTTGPQAKLHIKGNSDTSQVVIDAYTSQSNTRPLIRLRTADGVDLIHIHSDHTTNIFFGFNSGRLNNASGGALGNTFIGTQSGSSNVSGFSLTAIGTYSLLNNTSGKENTAIGPGTLYYNTSGSYNTAIGRGALFQNNQDHNTATGFKALFSNISGLNNTATGSQALVSNSSGSNNTANGFYALHNNTTGDANTATGLTALGKNNTGSDNTAIGFASLLQNTEGHFNTAVGGATLVSNIDGEGNTAIGCYANVAEGGLHNATVIGYDARVNASDKVRIGNPDVKIIEGQVAYSFPSDARFKYNIKSNVPGLDFIKKLNPVTYYFDEQKLDTYTKTGVINSYIAIPAANISRQLHTGFLAQDVEKIAREIGYDFDGIHAPANGRDHYSLAYSQFIMPLIKAVQEQQVMIEEQNKQIDFQQQQMNAMLKEIQLIKNKLK